MRFRDTAPGPVLKHETADVAATLVPCTSLGVADICYLEERRFPKAEAAEKSLERFEILRGLSFAGSTVTAASLAVLALTAGTPVGIALGAAGAVGAAALGCVGVLKSWDRIEALQGQLEQSPGTPTQRLMCRQEALEQWPELDRWYHDNGYPGLVNG